MGTRHAVIVAALLLTGLLAGCASSGPAGARDADPEPANDSDDLLGPQFPPPGSDLPRASGALDDVETGGKAGNGVGPSAGASQGGPSDSAGDQNGDGAGPAAGQHGGDGASGTGDPSGNGTADEGDPSTGNEGAPEDEIGDATDDPPAPSNATEPFPDLEDPGLLDPGEDPAPLNGSEPLDEDLLNSSDTSLEDALTGADDEGSDDGLLG